MQSNTEVGMIMKRIMQEANFVGNNSLCLAIFNYLWLSYRPTVMGTINLSVVKR